MIQPTPYMSLQIFRHQPLTPLFGRVGLPVRDNVIEVDGHFRLKRKRIRGLMDAMTLRRINSFWINDWQV